jgi:hypothetical protein
MYSSPLDEIDEVVVFSRAMHAACQATPQLLPMLGLSAEQGGIAAAVPREESLALHAWLAEGVRKGMGGDVHAQQQMLAQAPWQGVLPLPGAGAGGGGAPAFAFTPLGEGGAGAAPPATQFSFQPPR